MSKSLFSISSLWLMPMVGMAFCHSLRLIVPSPSSSHSLKSCSSLSALPASIFFMSSRFFISSSAFFSAGDIFSRAACLASSPSPSLRTLSLSLTRPLPPIRACSAFLNVSAGAGACSPPRLSAGLRSPALSSW